MFCVVQFYFVLTSSAVQAGALVVVSHAKINTYIATDIHIFGPVHLYGKMSCKF